MLSQIVCVWHNVLNICILLKIYGKYKIITREEDRQSGKKTIDVNIRHTANWVRVKERERDRERHREQEVKMNGISSRRE